MIDLKNPNRRFTVLCYGDSNTYGHDPASGLRLPENVRWTGRLAALLDELQKGRCRVIEEGCNGRTTVFQAPGEEWKSGLPYLKPCLNSHKPVDLVILMLGTNDLKKVFSASPEQIAEGAASLVCEIQEFTAVKQDHIPQIILVSPPQIGEGIASSSFSGSFDEDSIERSKKLPELYEKAAAKHNCIFFNAAEHVRPSKEDSVHLTAESHKKLAEALFHVVRECL